MVCEVGLAVWRGGLVCQDSEEKETPLIAYFLKHYSHDITTQITQITLKNGNHLLYIRITFP